MKARNGLSADWITANLKRNNLPLDINIKI